MSQYPLYALGPDGPYQTRKTEIITDVTGAPVAEMSLIPGLFISRAIAAQRKTPPLPVSDRRTALQVAAEVFRNATIAALTFDDYVELTRGVTGLPADLARAGAMTVSDSLTTAFDSVDAARPLGAHLDWRAVPPEGGAVWARRGEVLAVHAPGNAPGVHGLWPQALALGYRVAVRPSRREPFTAHRLVLALQEAGFRAADATYLPTGHDIADELVRWSDLALVYGGQGVVDKYAADPTVLTNGPGRAKILITGDQNWRTHIDMIVDSIAALAGMACVNTTAVLYEGDPAPLARAIADRLAAIPDADLPAMDAHAARTLARHLGSVAAGATALLGADKVVAHRDDGRATLRPAVHLLARPDTGALGTELPFPCVWIAPWSREDGIAPLQNSLVLTVLTDDEQLVDDLLAEPAVTNVYVGAVPTHHAAPHIPHEGFLADFLMRNKGFARA